MKTTMDTITMSQVEKLRDRAAQDGDTETVETCDRLINGKCWSHADMVYDIIACVEAINDCEAQS